MEVSHQGSQTWGYLPIDVHSYGHATVIGDVGEYLGPNPPDVSFLLLQVKDTPAVTFIDRRLSEGEFVGFAEFPMGTRLLRAPGWLHQIGPTLHGGIVSSVLPHSLAAVPHGFLIHANTQGGASGSPVFESSGHVAGMVYMTIQEEYQFGGNASEGDHGSTLYRVPTALTGCVPSQAIDQVLAASNEQAKQITDRPPLPEILSKAAIEEIAPGKGVLQQWKQLS